jgi:hypothetical protein
MMKTETVTATPKEEITNDRKLEAVIVTLTILLPRLTDPYRSDVEECIKLSKQVREDIKEKDGGDDKEGL